MSSSAFENIQYKASNGQVNLDEAQGIVECFVAGIGNKDSVGDICASGAFAKSLQRRKPRVVWGHNWNDPIGKVLEIYEVPVSDPRLPAKMKMAGIGGLYARVQFNLQSEKGREAFANVAFFGEEQEWSIGYKTIRAQYDQNLQANILYEVELYEVSPVLHGANQLTGTISVKSDEEKMHGMMPTMPTAPAPQTESIFAEGLAKPVSADKLAMLVAELSRRAGGPIKVVEATENSVTFIKPNKGKFRISYHFNGSEYMFGKPELLQAAEDKPMESGPTPIQGVEAKPNAMKPKPAAVAMPMPVAMKPGENGMVIVPLPPVKYEGDSSDKEPVVVAEEQELADALTAIAERHGKFNEDGTGVWAGYTPASENENADIGVKCANCILYQGGGKCKIIAREVEPEGSCRFAVIPDNVVQVGDKKKRYMDAMDDSELDMVAELEEKYPGEFILGVVRGLAKRRRKRRTSRLFKSLDQFGIEEAELESKGLDPFLAQESQYLIPVHPENAFEVKELLDPVLDYHRVDAYVNEDGIVISSGLNYEAKEALQNATKAAARRLGRSLTRGLGRSIGGRGRGMGMPGGDLDPRTRRDTDLDGTLFDGFPGWEQPDPTPSGPGSIDNPKPSRRQLTDTPSLSAGKRDVRRHATRTADVEKAIPDEEEDAKRAAHERIADKWEADGYGWSVVPKSGLYKNESSDFHRGIEIGHNQARLMWAGDENRKRPKGFSEKAKASNAYSDWHMSFAQAASRYMDANKSNSDTWRGISTQLRDEVATKMPDMGNWDGDRKRDYVDSLNRLGFSSGKRDKKKTPRQSWNEASRQDFADRNILRSRKVPKKRREGPTAEEFSSGRAEGEPVDWAKRVETLQNKLNEIDSRLDALRNQEKRPSVGQEMALQSEREQTERRLATARLNLTRANLKNLNDRNGEPFYVGKERITASEMEDIARDDTFYYPLINASLYELAEVAGYSDRQLEEMLTDYDYENDILLGEEDPFYSDEAEDSIKEYILDNLSTEAILQIALDKEFNGDKQALSNVIDEVFEYQLDDRIGADEARREAGFGSGRRINTEGSSAIASANFDEENGTFDVEFQNGSRYRYSDVDAADVEAFEAADSKGRAFADFRKKYTAERLSGPRERAGMSSGRRNDSAEQFYSPANFSPEDNMKIVERMRGTSAFADLDEAQNNVDAEVRRMGRRVPGSIVDLNEREANKAFVAARREEIAQMISAGEIKPLRNVAEFSSGRRERESVDWADRFETSQNKLKEIDSRLDALNNQGEQYSIEAINLRGQRREAETRLATARLNLTRANLKNLNDRNGEPFYVGNKDLTAEEMADVVTEDEFGETVRDADIYELAEVSGISGRELRERLLRFDRDNEIYMPEEYATTPWSDWAEEEEKEWLIDNLSTEARLQLVLDKDFNGDKQALSDLIDEVFDGLLNYRIRKYGNPEGRDRGMSSGRRDRGSEEFYNADNFSADDNEKIFERMRRIGAFRDLDEAQRNNPNDEPDLNEREAINALKLTRRREIDKMIDSGDIRPLRDMAEFSSGRRDETSPFDQPIDWNERVQALQNNFDSIVARQDALSREGRGDSREWQRLEDSLDVIGERLARAKRQRDAMGLSSGRPDERQSFEDFARTRFEESGARGSFENWMRRNEDDLNADWDNLQADMRADGFSSGRDFLDVSELRQWDDLGDDEKSAYVEQLRRENWFEDGEDEESIDDAAAESWNEAAESARTTASNELVKEINDLRTTATTLSRRGMLNYNTTNNLFADVFVLGSLEERVKNPLDAEFTDYQRAASELNRIRRNIDNALNENRGLSSGRRSDQSDFTVRVGGDQYDGFRFENLSFNAPESFVERWARQHARETLSSQIPNRPRREGPDAVIAEESTSDLLGRVLRGPKYGGDSRKMVNEVNERYQDLREQRIYEGQEAAMSEAFGSGRRAPTDAEIDSFEAYGYDTAMEKFLEENPDKGEDDFPYLEALYEFLEQRDDRSMDRAMEERDLGALSSGRRALSDEEIESFIENEYPDALERFLEENPGKSERDFPIDDFYKDYADTLTDRAMDRMKQDRDRRDGLASGRRDQTDGEMPDPYGPFSDRRIVEARMNGATLDELSERLRIPRTEVRRREQLFLHGLRDEKNSDRAIFNRREAGETLDSISQDLKISREEIRQRELRYRAKLRKAKEAPNNPLEKMQDGFSSGKEKKTREDVISEIQKTLIAMLETADPKDWSPPWSRIGAANNPVTGKKYSGVNPLILSFTEATKGYKSTMWATFKQWNDRGAKIKGGEKGTLLYRPTFKSVIDEETGKKKTVPSGYLVYSVFNLEQTTGLKESELLGEQISSEQRVADLEEGLMEVGAAIQTGGDSAYYSPSTDSITMPAFETFRDPESYYAVLAHEMVHWSGHSDRLNRPNLNAYGTPAYAQEELVAEIASAMILGLLGVTAEPREDHAQYLKGWLRALTEDPQALSKAFAEAEKAADFVIGKSPKLKAKSIASKADGAAPSEPALSSGRRLWSARERAENTFSNLMRDINDRGFAEGRGKSGKKLGRNELEKMIKDAYGVNADYIDGNIDLPSDSKIRDAGINPDAAHVKFANSLRNVVSSNYTGEQVGPSTWAHGKNSLIGIDERDLTGPDGKKPLTFASEYGLDLDGPGSNWRMRTDITGRQFFARESIFGSKGPSRWITHDLGNGKMVAYHEAADGVIYQAANEKGDSVWNYEFDGKLTPEFGSIDELDQYVDSYEKSRKAFTTELNTARDAGDMDRVAELLDDEMERTKREYNDATSRMGIMSLSSGSRNVAIARIDGGKSKLSDDQWQQYNADIANVLKTDEPNFSSGRRTREDLIDPSEITNVREMMNRTDELGSNSRAVAGNLNYSKDPYDFDTIKAGSPVKFKYKGKDRTVYPTTLLAGKDGGVYFVGLDDEINQYRSFRLDKIEGMIDGARPPLNRRLARRGRADELSSGSRNPVERDAADRVPPMVQEKNEFLNKQDVMSENAQPSTIAENAFQLVEERERLIADLIKQNNIKTTDRTNITDLTDDEDFWDVLDDLDESIKNHIDWLDERQSEWEDRVGMVDFTSWRRETDLKNASNLVDEARFSGDEDDRRVALRDAIDALMEPRADGETRAIESASEITDAENPLEKARDLLASEISVAEQEYRDFEARGERFSSEDVYPKRLRRPHEIANGAYGRDRYMSTPGLSSGRRVERMSLDFEERGRLSKIMNEAANKFVIDSNGRRISGGPKVGNISENATRKPDGPWMLSFDKLRDLIRNGNGEELSTKDLAKLFGITESQAEMLDAPGAAIDQATVFSFFDIIPSTQMQSPVSERMLRDVWGWDAYPYWYDPLDWDRGPLTRVEYDDLVDQKEMPDGLLFPADFDPYQEIEAEAGRSIIGGARALSATPQSKLFESKFGINAFLGHMGIPQDATEDEIRSALTVTVDDVEYIPTPDQMRRWRERGIPTGIVEQMVESGLIPNAGEVFGPIGEQFDSEIKRTTALQRIVDMAKDSGKMKSMRRLGLALGDQKLERTLATKPKFSLQTTGKADRNRVDRSEVERMLDNVNRAIGTEFTIDDFTAGLPEAQRQGFSSGRKAAEEIANVGDQLTAKLSGGSRPNRGAPARITPKMQDELIYWAKNKGSWSGFAKSLVKQLEANGFLTESQWSKLLNLHDSEVRKRFSKR